MEKRQQINPYNNKNKLVSKNDIENILKKYNIFQNINNLDYYQQAFVHDSYSMPYIKNTMERDNVSLVTLPDGYAPLQPSSYERLEYLGDAVVELIISNYLFQRYPNDDEGFLSKLRVSLVNRIAMAHLTRILGLSKYLLISKTLEEKENSRFKESILEDIFEAFIGAIFLDFNQDKHGQLNSFNSGTGFQIAEKFLITLIEDVNTEIDFTDLILDDGNYKGKLVKYFKKVHKISITFKTVDSIGSSVEKEVSIKIIRDDNNNTIGTGKGIDTKQAHHNGAKNTLIKLGLID